MLKAPRDPFIDHSQVYPGISCGEFNCDPLLGQLVTITASGNVDDIDFSFHPDAIVRGKVKDMATGAGLDGATVSGYIPVATPIGTLYALVWSTISHGPDGDYELYLRSYDPFQFYYIVAENAAPNISTAFPGVSCTYIMSCLGNAVPLSVRPASDNENINMSLPLGSAISGVVTDALSGTPLLANINVFDEKDNQVARAITAEDGSYAFDAFPAETYYAIADRVGWQPGCLVYDNRPCPASGMPLSSVDPTPLMLKPGEIRNDTNFPMDTNTIFSDSFDP